MEPRRVYHGKNAMNLNAPNPNVRYQDPNSMDDYPNTSSIPNSTLPMNTQQHHPNYPYSNSPSQTSRSIHHSYNPYDNQEFRTSYSNSPSQDPYNNLPPPPIYADHQNPNTSRPTRRLQYPPMNSQDEYENYHPTHVESIHESGDFYRRGGRGTRGGGQRGRHSGNEELTRGNVGRDSCGEVVEVNPKKAPEKWSHDDDKVLCGAWFTHSTDCVVGTNQNAGVFWMKITDEVNEYRKNTTRTLGSCKTRWNKIAAEIGKYVAAELRATRYLNERGSGSGPVDLRTKADEFFFDDNEGKQFKFHHCYEVCKGNPKFIGQYATQKRAQQGTGAGGDFAEDSSSPNIDLGLPHYPARPMGVKSAKCKASGGKGKSKSSDHRSSAESRGMEFQSMFNNATMAVEAVAEKERKREEYNLRQYEIYQGKMEDQRVQREFLIAQSERDVLKSEREAAQSERDAAKSVRDERQNLHTTLNLLLAKSELTDAEERLRDRVIAMLYQS